MRASKLAIEILNQVKNCGDGEIYLVSSIDGFGSYVGRINGISIDADNDHLITGDIDATSVTGKR